MRGTYFGLQTVQTQAYIDAIKAVARNGTYSSGRRVYLAPEMQPGDL